MKLLGIFKKRYNHFFLCISKLKNIEAIYLIMILKEISFYFDQKNEEWRRRNCISIKNYDVNSKNLFKLVKKPFKFIRKSSL